MTTRFKTSLAAGLAVLTHGGGADADGDRPQDGRPQPRAAGTGLWRAAAGWTGRAGHARPRRADGFRAGLP